MFSFNNLVTSNARTRRSESAGRPDTFGATMGSTKDAVALKTGHNATSRFEAPTNRLVINVYSIPDTEIIEITNYPIELLQELEQYTDIGILHDRWCRFGGPPHKNNFHPRSANAACFSVSSEHPMDFEYSSTEDPTQTLPIRKLDSELMQKQAMDDLVLVKETSEPLYQQVIHRIGTMEIYFRRILLPVTDDEGQVELIYSATRQFGTVEPEFFETERC